MNTKFKIRNLYRVRNFKILEKIPNKAVVYKSKEAFAQYFILPGFFTLISLSFFRRNNFEPKYLLIMIFGFIISFILNFLVAKLILKKPEIILNKIGITFRNSRTIFWNEIEYFKLKKKNSILGIYIKTESEEFFLDIKHLAITKTKLKVLINSFLKKYRGAIKRNYQFLAKNFGEVDYVDFSNCLNNKNL